MIPKSYSEEPHPFRRTTFLPNLQLIQALLQPHSHRFSICLVIIKVWHLRCLGGIGSHPYHLLLPTRTFDLREHLVVKATPKSYSSGSLAVVLGSNVGGAVGRGFGREE